MPRTAIFGFLKSKTKGSSKSTLGIFPARVRHAMLEGVSQPQTFKKFGELKSNGGILEIIDEIKIDVQNISNSDIEKDNIIQKLNNLKNKLEI